MAFVRVSFRDVEDRDRNLKVRLEHLVGQHYFQGDSSAREYYIYLTSKSLNLSSQYYLKVGRCNFHSDGSEHGIDTIQKIVFLRRDLEKFVGRPDTGAKELVVHPLELKELFSILTDALLAHYNQRIQSADLGFQIPQPEVLLIDGSPSDREILSILNAS